MKIKLNWWQIAGLVIDIIGAVFLVLCIATDINDDLFLPLALCCILLVNAAQLILNYKKYIKK